LHATTGSVTIPFFRRKRGSCASVEERLGRLRKVLDRVNAPYPREDPEAGLRHLPPARPPHKTRRIAEQTLHFPLAFTGRIALLEGGFLTGLRTGAASALAARYLARKDARTLVCFGAGVQAGFQVRCLTAELPIERVTVIGRDPERARRFSLEWGERLHLPVAVTTDADGAVATADVVTCATTAVTPLFDGRRLRAGTHVDGVGSFQPTIREVDAETVRRARVVVDQPGTIDNAGDIAIAIKDGVVTRAHVVGDLAGVVSGAVAGRTRPDEITLFKSEGFALEDLVAARLAYARAQARGLGREVDL